MNKHLEQLEEMLGLDKYKEIWTEVTKLPWKKGLVVKDDLNLSGTKITKLPDNLKVGGNLYLSKNQKILIPNSVKIGGKIYHE